MLNSWTHLVSNYFWWVLIIAFIILGFSIWNLIKVKSKGQKRLNGFYVGILSIIIIFIVFMK